MTALQKLAGNIAGAGTGSVTSVGLSLPSLFTVTGSPITSSGTLTATLATQTANQIWAGPTSGGAAAPAFRALVAGDLPVLTGYTSGAGTVAATDTILQAIQKLNGNALTTASTPQFAGLGLGTAAVSGWELTMAGGLCQLRQSVSVSGSTYTLDVQAANEFVTAAAINGATTINLSNLNTIPSGYVWRGVLSFQYTSGTVTWFGGNAGFTVKWDGGSAPTLTANELETMVITVVGGGNTIEVAPLKGRA